MSILSHVCLVLAKAREVIGSLGPGVTDGNEMPCRFWGESSLGTLEKQPILLNLSHILFLMVF